MEITAYAFGICAFVFAAVAALLGVLQSRDLCIWATCISIVLAVVGGFCWLQDTVWKKDALTKRDQANRPWIVVGPASLKAPLKRGRPFK